MTLYLTKDCYSNVTQELYGATGTPVRLVSVQQDNANVVIVEDEHGKRFPVNRNKLSETRPLFAQAKLPVPEPVKVKGKKKIAHSKLF